MHWRQSLEELFEPQVKRIMVMNHRDSDTGLLAFGYPEDRYGYDTFTALDADDIPYLVMLAAQAGFVLSSVYDPRNDPNAPESAKTDDPTLSFSYCIPGAKTWRDFPDNFVSVNAWTL
jgi:hypothetical protein